MIALSNISVKIAKSSILNLGARPSWVCYWVLTRKLILPFAHVQQNFSYLRPFFRKLICNAQNCNNQRYKAKIDIHYLCIITTIQWCSSHRINIMNISWWRSTTSVIQKIKLLFEILLLLQKQNSKSLMRKAQITPSNPTGCISFEVYIYLYRKQQIG